tara:strand:+ start:48 stop:1004 length:957 start_codon:yes stop_codon:yes gene_type:complete
MKLIIQIPCYNEEDSLPITFNNLPKNINGIDQIKTLVINDGSTDNTLKVAKTIGVDYILSFSNNKGLAKAFSMGIDKCLELGADIIVNTDADNQYFGDDIKKLVDPIINNQADIVVGSRAIDEIEDFSWFKKKLQKIGSYFVRKLSNTDVQDTVSGFRAFTRSAAMRINIFTGYSYTIESLIQFGYEKASIVSVPIRTNKNTRESRLFKSIPSFIANQLITIIRSFSTYKPLKVFTIIGLITIIPGIFGFMRFLYFYFTVGGEGHIQSLIFSTVLINIGFIVLMSGIIADLISSNRKLTENILYFLKKIVFDKKNVED